jgi:4a-hydroxytetrahydrobiopterin dehydratase
MTNLRTRHCKPCTGETPKLTPGEIELLLPELRDWKLDRDKSISRRFEFDDFYETMAFVNALAWIAHREDHHPDLEVGYKTCLVRYSTHAVSGLSDNDFICAAKIDALVE